MPELPEVETVVRRLSRVLPGKRISRIEVLRKKSFQGIARVLYSQEIEKVSRRAKIIRLHVSGKHDILIHLKMTGQLIFIDSGKKVGGGHPTADWIHSLPSKHTRVIFRFADRSILYFNDMRVFGWVKVVSDKERTAEYAKYGPDANSREVTETYLKKMFSQRRIPIKQALMDNSVLSGVGNIYASEALFYARIHPLKPAGTLTSRQWKQVFQAVKKVMREGIQAGGTTFDGKYVDISGLSGKYQKKLKVYGQKGKPCPRCKRPIRKIQQGGRGTYFCPFCQKR